MALLLNVASPYPAKLVAQSSNDLSGCLWAASKPDQVSGRPIRREYVRSFHTYITEALENGVDSAVLKDLVGHRDTKMISTVYSHLTERPDFLKKQAKRARGA